MLDLDPSGLILSWAGVNLLAFGLFVGLELLGRWREKRAETTARTTTSLEELIARTEREEARSPNGPAPGSDAWWSTWAETGGRLPSAADSCRPVSAGTAQVPGIGGAGLARGLSRVSTDR